MSVPLPIPEPVRRALDDLACTWNQTPPAGMLLAQAQALTTQSGLSLREIEIMALQSQIVPERYRRNLGTVGWDGQIALLQSKVVVVGAGGLGGWICELLARMGVGHLTIIDGDTFQENNLNRQLGCTLATLGRSKATCLAERLTQLNQATKVIAHHDWLTEANAAELISGADVVVDALDTLPARLLLQDACQAEDIPMVHGAIGGYTGQVLTILPQDRGLRALYGQGPWPERGVEQTLGNPSATPMMVAAWQVQEVVKLLVGSSTLLHNRLLLMDAERGETTEVGLG